MNDSHGAFRDRLLAAEHSTPTEKYQHDLATLGHRRFSVPQRLTMLLLAAFCLMAAFRMAHRAVQADDLRLLTQIGSGMGAVIAVVWAGALLLTAKRGVLRPNKFSPIACRTFLTLGAVALGAGTFVALGSPDRLRGIQILLVEILVLLGAFIVIIQRFVQELHLRLREKLLELQIQLHELFNDQGHK